MDNDIIKQTENWIKQVVIGLLETEGALFDECAKQERKAISDFLDLGVGVLLFHKASVLVPTPPVEIVDENSDPPAIPPPVYRTIISLSQKSPEDSISVYIIRTQTGPIPNIKSQTEAASIMPNFVEIAYFSGQPLAMLESAITEVYLPLLCNLNEIVLDDDKKKNVFKSDIVIMMQRFASQISHTSQQLVSEIRLKIPEGNCNANNRSNELVVKSNQ